MRLILPVLFLVIATGCGDSKSEAVSLDNLPEPVVKSAKENLPGIVFERAWKTSKGNYEVRGRTKNGKVRDIQVGPDGTVVEVD
jgi:hypothetical protein